MSRRAAPPKRVGPWIEIGLTVLVGLGIFLAWRAQAPRAPPAPIAGERAAIAATSPAPAIARRETRPTLDPARFVGKAARAHEVAREIPEVLDQLYCYCECDRHLGHK